MRFCHFTSALAMMLILSACGSSKEDSQATETRMDTLDSLEGTISDDMINTDEAVNDMPVQSDAQVLAPVTSGDAAPTKTEAVDTVKVEASGEPK
jgi:predicted component of type VI protein secretion system